MRSPALNGFHKFRRAFVEDIAPTLDGWPTAIRQGRRIPLRNGLN